MRLLVVTTGHEGLVVEVLQNALDLVHRSGDPADGSSSGELLDGVDDSLVTLGHLTILFWLPGGRFAGHASNVGATRSTGVNCSVANA